MPKAKMLVAFSVFLAVAVFLVHDYNASQAGYVAVYSVLGMWMLCGFGVVLGLTLVFFRKTRRLGAATLASGVLLPCAFFVGIRISESRGWVLWANQPMRAFGPGVQAGEVVYYKLGVTDAQTESFQRTSLYHQRADGAGFDFKPGITSFMRLSPSQAHGHNGFAIGISPSLPQDDRDQLRSLLTQSPLVFRIYHDIAPEDIPAP